jgi:hypothetical protein
LLAEVVTNKEVLLLIVIEVELELAMLELDQIGDDEAGGYTRVGFDVGVGVDEAPGPSPSQVML